MFTQLRQLLRGRIHSPDQKEPEEAYDLWSSVYDSQPGNLVLDMDNALFSALWDSMDMQGKSVVDIGCGTGRHWPDIWAKTPASLTGYDVSEGMLERLRHKFPSAHAYKISFNGIPPLAERSVDCVISTLALAHIADMEAALAAWSSALKIGGYLLLTDFHPTALSRGAQRTFVHGNGPVGVRSFVHTLGGVEKAALSGNLTTMQASEREVDESVRHYYEARNALSVYEQYKGVPMVYGFLFKKRA